MDEPGAGHASIRPRVGLVAGPALCLLFLSTAPPEGLATQAWSVAAVAVLMAVWWVTEAIPVGATALLPLALYPTLGIMDSTSAAASYAHHLVFLFLGGFWIAIAMERWGLHRRIAFQIVSRVGGGPSSAILGFMLATGFLSMWLSNTATVMMMLPIGLAVAGYSGGQGGESMQAGHSPPFAMALMLGIAYAASIGGVATLIGTPPNAIFAGVAETLYGERISFGRWMLVGLPLASIMLLLCWLFLTRVAFRGMQLPATADRECVLRELAQLGPLSREERLVALVFVAVAGGWLLRGFLEWDLLRRVTDSTIAMAGALLLFLLPGNTRQAGRLLDWASAVRIPWEVILLFGGGFALAKGFESSGLALWIGERLLFVEGLPPAAVLLVITLLTIFLTEVTSNTATASMLLPIVAGVAQGVGLHPYQAMAATALAASFAFMLPAATPPNAIVFASGCVTIPQMARVGFWLNLIGALLISAGVSVLVALAWGG